VSHAGRVLVTGATGFIGSRCLPLLLEAGFEVHATTQDERERLDGVTWHCADLLDRQETTALVATIRPTHLLHFAWVVSHGDYWTATENLQWVTAGLDLARAFAESGGRRAVTAGTCAEYDWAQGQCVEGVTPLRPATLYGASKCALHLASAAYYGLQGVSAAWGHIFYLYGPAENPGRLVAAAANAMLSGERFVCVHPDHVRDYLHVDDVASAFVALLAADVEGDVNIASGEPVTLGAIVQEVARASGRPDLAALEPAPDDAGPRVLTAGAARLRNGTGWEPRFNLAVGVDQTVDWWRQRTACS